MPKAESEDEAGTLPKPVLDALAVIRGHADAEAIIESIAGTTLYQSIFDAGHREATTRARTKEQKLLKRATDAETARDEAVAQVEELRTAKPDEAVREQKWQKQLDAERKRGDDAEAKVIEIARERIRDKLEATLKTRLRPRLAELLAESLADSIVPNDEGEYDLMDGDTAVVIPRGKTVFDVVTEREVKKAEPVDLLARSDKGPRERTGPQGEKDEDDGDGKPKDPYFSNLRKNIEKERAQQAAARNPGASAKGAPA